MAKIVLILLFLCCRTENKNFGNSIIQITKNAFIDIQKAQILPSYYGTNYLMDSKLEGTKIAFLSSPILENYYDIQYADKIIHLIKLDMSSSQIILFNDFLKFSQYQPSNSICDWLCISKILNVDPLIIYINSSIII